MVPVGIKTCSHTNIVFYKASILNLKETVICTKKITDACNFFVWISYNFYTYEANKRCLSSYTHNHKINNNNKYYKTTTAATTNITTRLDSDTLSELQDEADRTGITLSNLTKQILTNYARWDKFVSKAGMIPVAKGVISEVFNRLDEGEVVELARSVGKNALSDIILFMKGKIDMDSLFSWLELWLKRNATAGFSHVVENGLHTCIMKHGLGLKWSLYHKMVLQLILNEILGEESSTLEINIDENILILKFKENDDNNDNQ